MSRRFYILAEAGSKTTLETCARYTDQLMRYGVDLDDEDMFYFGFDGKISLSDLIFEQCKSILRVTWNSAIRITEIGEDIDGYSMVIYGFDKEKRAGLSEMYDMMDDWIENPPDVILDDYLSQSETENDSDKDGEEAEDETD